ncbi:uL13 family ribosomal protein [Bacillus pumilus]
MGGKEKGSYRGEVDRGDDVIMMNGEKMEVRGKKLREKI